MNEIKERGPIAGFLASAVSTAAVYPLETSKVRSQSGAPFVWNGEESPTFLPHPFHVMQYGTSHHFFQ